MTFSGPAGRLEALLDEPVGAPRAAVVLAHPHPQYGGTMHARVMFRSAKAFQRIGCAVLRFNFRGTGLSDGEHDGSTGEQDDFRAGVEFMAARYAALDLWAAGYSFGAWVALSVGATNDRVSAMVGIAAPVYQYDFSAVHRSTKPKFLIHGERDEVCSIHDIWRFYGQLSEPKELVVVDAADHTFDGSTSQVGDAIEDLMGDFSGAVGHVNKA